MLTGRRYRLELTTEQEAQCREFSDVCRAVWNVGLEQRRAYRQRRTWVGYHDQARELAEAKCDHEWLKAAPSHVLQQTLMDLDQACRRHGALKVRWRSSRHWRPSLRFPDSNQISVQKLNRSHGRLKLPKLGWIKFRMSRPLQGVIRSCTLQRRGNHWFAAFLIDDGVETPQGHAVPGSSVGIDRGVAAAVAMSDGQLLNRETLTSGERRRALALQRRLSRTSRRSRNRDKARVALAQIHRRERSRRLDFCSKVANKTASAYAVVVLEDLHIGQMTRSAKGTVDNPGRNVKAKSGLNRAILSKGWNQFELALRSAARYSGSEIVKVPAAHTSQRCSSCGRIDPKSRKSQAVFRCTSCLHHEHADVNAAKNILAAGLAVTACQGRARPMKQELAGNRKELLLQSA
ncbi:RNA-guided endonuclease InsQ/TnpB family protein [Mycobacteroides saopaulense]|uniref:RNA-guided endonuclease InsQ/TnpB family protein n=1 Tax=Mycobacteroides saopaulense TaxID=1578165 RepID=UPI0009F5655A|nr:RNA-guided endonuclease TnpB family protein [Mycobacteroides saopaulense]